MVQFSGFRLNIRLSRVVFVFVCLSRPTFLGWHAPEVKEEKKGKRIQGKVLYVNV